MWTEVAEWEEPRHPGPVVGKLPHFPPQCNTSFYLVPTRTFRASTEAIAPQAAVQTGEMGEELHAGRPHATRASA